ncbi:hypothetical protein [Arcanobacterium pinnipediorum]|uniref:Uncharacterized protein n=1 Tax=Arcanobacterium pinnipediorum TaxID=1503041 RepID=A0ABY5AFC1_9ACTO|nr:hypothetical protein [Arcanobacterium pinnipediorum]USR78909.1 hypothetical protein NG665_05830 [Arcanobacterium pinnipediorum]
MNNSVLSRNVALVTALSGACNVLVSVMVGVANSLRVSVPVALGVVVDQESTLVPERLIKGC